MNDPDHAGVEAELAELRQYRDELEESIDDFEHQARRCRDRLERSGGESHQAARELKQLEKNRDFNRRELERAGQRIRELEKRLEDGNG